MKEPTTDELLAANDPAGLYARWLREQKKQLKFTDIELARAIGKSRRTVAGYLHGYNYKPLPEEVRAAIRSYIDWRQNGVQGYYIPSPKRFGALLKELLRQAELTEQQLAELIGRDQKTVSQYITGDLAADKEQQYFILYSARYNYIFFALRSVLRNEKEYQSSIHSYGRSPVNRLPASFFCFCRHKI